jgi:hypothetical protein
MDSFADLQPHLEVPYSAILSEIQAESYKDPLWRLWLKAARNYSFENQSHGREIREVLHLGSHLMGVTHLGICFAFDFCK